MPTTHPTTRSRRLSLSYLAVIMTMSLLFSAVIFFVTSTQLDRPLPPPPMNTIQQQFGGVDAGQDNTQARLDARSAETRSYLLVSLAALNLVVLAGGMWASHRLARWTLLPIETALEAQSRFICDASHELRTPLTALQATNEVALRKPRLDEIKARQVLHKNIGEIAKLRSLTDGLLDLAQTAQQPTTAVSFDLTELITDLLEQVQPLAGRQDCALVFDSKQRHILTANPGAVRQILLIFLDNAIKYSPRHSPIAITITAAAHVITIAVTDQGPGIAKADQHRVFDRFFRTDSARTRATASGHGLGLAIAKNTAAHHGYALSLHSIPDKVTTFRLTIPD